MNTRNTKKVVDELAIPRDSIVVEYVAGKLSEHAHQQFEAKLRDDSELQEAVAHEQTLRQQIQSTAQHDTHIASDQCAELLERVDAYEALEQDAVFQEEFVEDTVVIERNSNVVSLSTHRKSYAIAASVAMLGLVVALLSNSLPSLSPNQDLSPRFEGLSAEATTDLPSLVSQDRIAKLTLAAPLGSKAVSEMLAAYQLELVSQVPEQSALIVLANDNIEPKMLMGWRNDNRIANAELVSQNVEKK